MNREAREAEIKALREEALLAGDHKMASLCVWALEGDEEALTACNEALDWAAAMDDREGA